ncbi:methionine ABC transporter permease [Actinocorallia longicatena]|uniref:ABC transporter permease n=1 Tax=Actinocorallia longicatena TaxID=111803 RepID=A0ABP6QH93_9ACTN
MTTDLFGTALGETWHMMWISTILTAAGGLLLGVLLHLTDRTGLLPFWPVNKLLGLIVNIGRSLPFLILMVALIPFTRTVTGTTFGATAAIVPLTVGAIPFFARLVEASLREVDPGVVSAARAMGASRGQIVTKVLLREARPGLVSGLTITVIALIGFSSIVGVIGGGGIGDLAIRYGYQRYDTQIMILCVVVLVVLVQAVQMLGDLVVRRISHK